MAKLTANGVTIEGTVEELAVLMTQMTAKADEVESLEVGDYAKVVARTSTESYMTHEFEINEIVRVEEKGFHEDAIKCRQVGGSNYDFLNPSDLVRATEEEIVQAEVNVVFTDAGREPNEYRKGDIIRYEGDADEGIYEVSHTKVGEVHFFCDKFGNTTEFMASNTIVPIVFVENRLDRN